MEKSKKKSTHLADYSFKHRVRPVKLEVSGKLAFRRAEIDFSKEHHKIKKKSSGTNFYDEPI